MKWLVVVLPSRYVRCDNKALYRSHPVSYTHLWALMTETPQAPVSLAYLSQQFDRHLTDLVLVEGFKQEPIPKILLHRQEMTKPLPELDENVLALATDYSLETDRTLLDINPVSYTHLDVYKRQLNHLNVKTW